MNQRTLLKKTMSLARAGNAEAFQNFYILTVQETYGKICTLVKDEQAKEMLVDIYVRLYRLSLIHISIQAQILNLMMDLQDSIGLTYMFITHDLSVVKHISDEIAVMYLGQCVERVSSKELFVNPMHPYTQALLSAIPIPDLSMRGKPRQILKGEVKSPIEPPAGCRFASRCPHATDECRSRNFSLKEVEPGHHVACRLYE